MIRGHAIEIFCSLEINDSADGKYNQMKLVRSIDAFGLSNCGVSAEREKKELHRGKMTKMSKAYRPNAKTEKQQTESVCVQ